MGVVGNHQIPTIDIAVITGYVSVSYTVECPTV